MENDGRIFLGTEDSGNYCTDADTTEKEDAFAEADTDFEMIRYAVWTCNVPVEASVDDDGGHHHHDHCDHHHGRRGRNVTNVYEGCETSKMVPPSPSPLWFRRWRR